MSKLPTEREILGAISLRERSAAFRTLAHAGPLPEPSRYALVKRLGRDLTALEAMVYGYVRRAIAMGYAGAWISYWEMAVLTRFSKRSVRRAVKALEELRVVVKTPQWEELEGPRRTRYANAWTLGPLAYRNFAPRRRGGGDTVTPPGDRVTPGGGDTVTPPGGHSGRTRGHSGRESGLTGTLTTDLPGQGSREETRASVPASFSPPHLPQDDLAEPQDVRDALAVFTGGRP